MYSPAAHPYQADLVDLRSDTVTRPTPEMFAAMQAMPVGDDVLGDDPTVIELERLAAQMTGKEAALFVPSGTMGNQIALACHCQPGDAILIEEEAHVLYYEVGGPALIAGVVSWTLPSVRGAMDPEHVERRVLKANLHTPGTALLCLENTHNRAGGAIIPLETMAAYRGVADRHGMRVHLDGARVFNAAVGLGVPVREIAQHVDSVNFCLSKGLRAPVGSLLCGDSDFLDIVRAADGSPYVGKVLRLDDVHVPLVAGDQVFTIGPSDADSILVKITEPTDPGNQSEQELVVNEGDRVMVVGRLRPYPSSEKERRFGLSEAEQARIGNKTLYVEGRLVEEIASNGPDIPKP